METMSKHCLKYNVIYSFKCVLQPQLNFYTTSATTSTIEGAPHSLFSLKNLLVGSLGFSEKQALSTSTKLAKLRQIRGATKVSGCHLLKNVGSVISFLETKGFTKPQIKNIVFSVPQILTVRIDKTLEPKMKTFQEMGFSVSDFAEVILNQPRILGYGLHSTIQPAFEALRVVMGSDENVVKVIKKFKVFQLAFMNKYLVSNVSLLRARGIPIEAIQKRILQRPSFASRRTEELKDAMIQVEEKWGIYLGSSMFLDAVDFLCCHTEKNMESKCQVFESFGWDRADVVHLFRRNPNFLSASEGKIKAVLSFYMNELGYDRDYIVAHPALIHYSLEKRVLPRHLVVQVLKEKGLVREDLSLYTALLMTESKFMKRFIQPFQDVMPNLRETYVTSVGSS